VLYAAQANALIDAKLVKKGGFRTETVQAARKVFRSIRFSYPQPCKIR
jgi:hypothetical protein